MIALVLALGFGAGWLAVVVCRHQLRRRRQPDPWLALARRDGRAGTRLTRGPPGRGGIC